MTPAHISTRSARIQFRFVIGACVCSLMASCGSGPNYYRPSFVEMARVPRTVKVLDKNGKVVEVAVDSRTDRNAELRFSDQVAINYANEMINVLAPKFNRARYASNASATLQTASSGLVAGNAATKLGAQALSWLGVSNLLLPGIQGIFDAKGRSQAYLKAAYEIKSAINEYQSFNQNPSGSVLTQNGVTLVHRTDAAIHVVESFLAGEMPDPVKVRQMVEPMSTKGAVVTAAGSPVYNNISSSGLRQAVAEIPLSQGRSTDHSITLPGQAYLLRVESLLGRVDGMKAADAIKAANDNLGLALTANDGAKATSVIYRAIAELRNTEDVKAVEKWEAIVPPLSATQSRIDKLIDKAGSLGDRAVVIANQKWPSGPSFTSKSKAIQAIRRALIVLQQTPDETEITDWEKRINGQ